MKKRISMIIVLSMLCSLIVIPKMAHAETFDFLIPLSEQGENGFIAPIHRPWDEVIDVKTISTENELAAIDGGIYVLQNDITITNDWIPIQPSGAVVLEGGGHKIYNLNISADEDEVYTGLFGYCNNYIEIRNLGIESGKIESKALSRTYTGAFIAYGNSILLENCYNTAVVSNENDSTKGEGIHCTGGLIGYGGTVTLKHCYNTRTVFTSVRTASNSNLYSGGLIGGDDSATLVNCFNTGTVQSQDGFNLGTTAYAESSSGGLIATSNKTLINNCYNKGNVFCSGGGCRAWAGGLMSNSRVDTEIINSYNAGDIYSEPVCAYAFPYASAGGLIGYGTGNVAIGNSANYGNITAYELYGSMDAFARRLIGDSGDIMGHGTFTEAKPHDGMLHTELDFYDTYDKENDTYSGKIEVLTHSMGNFAWEKSNYNSLPDHEKNNYNKMYMRVSVSAKSESDSGQDAFNVNVHITAPDGFSFEEFNMVSEKDIMIEYIPLNETERICVEVYPIYSETYGNEDSVLFTTSTSSTNWETNEEETNAFTINKNENEGIVKLETGVDYRPSFNANMLSGSSYEYNHNLAKLCLSLSSSEYHSSAAENNEAQITSSYKNLGFSNIMQYNDVTAGIEEIHHSIASKKMIINDSIYTIVAVSCRGTTTGSAEEWIGNFYIGMGDDVHHSFNAAKDDVYKNLTDYMDYYKLNSSDHNVKVLVNGHSRGGAVANLLAADFDNGSAEYVSAENVYTYTFAAANTDRNADTANRLYGNIFNIVINNDLVPKVPLYDENIYMMGFKKYGIICVFPTESSERYNSYLQSVKEKYRFYSGGKTYNPLTASDMIQLRRNNLALQSIIAIAKFNKILCSHDLMGYLSWLEAIDSTLEYKSETETYKVVKVNASADIEVRDSQNNIVGEVTNNMLEDPVDHNVYIEIIDDLKVIYLPDNDMYHIDIKGYEDTLVSYTIEEYSEDTGKTRVVNYMNIPISANETITGFVDNITNTDVENYNLTLSDNTVMTATDDLTGDEIDNLSVMINVTGNGYVSGMGNYTKNEKVTLIADGDGSMFDGWYINDELITSDALFSFSISSDVEIEARFHANEHSIDIEKNGSSLVINVANCTDVNNSVIAALYNSDGCMIECKIKSPNEAKECEFLFDNTEGSYIKVMEWRSIGGMKPISTANIIDI